MGLEMFEMCPLTGGAQPMGSDPPVAFRAAHALGTQPQGSLTFGLSGCQLRLMTNSIGSGRSEVSRLATATVVS